MAVVNGTSANNNLTGTAGADTIDGLAGADTMTGGDGNDVYIVDNLGDVVVEAGTSGSGTDTLRTSVLDALATYSLERFAYVENLTYTGALAALLKGNAQANVIASNSAASTNDTLYGGAGNDTLSSFAGSDLLMGGSGHDVLNGGTGTDTMVGGTGDDRYVIDGVGDRVYEYVNGGFDTIQSSVAKDLRLAWTQQVEGLTYTGTTAAALFGNARDNLIQSASASNDTLTGGDGNDTLDGGAGTDSMIGGLGNDFYFVQAADLVTEQVGEGTDTLVGLRTSLGIAAFSTTVENLFYTSATGATLTGNGLDNVISGGAGADTVNGGNGNDSLLGGAGVDSLVGGNGDDVLYGGANPDYVWVPNRKLVPDTAADRLVGGNGNDRYLIDNSNDVVVEAPDGGAGSDVGTLDVVISAIDNSLTRYANVEALVLQRDSTAFFGQGTAGANILVGNERDNLLVGGGGDDTMAGFVDVANILEPQSDVVDAGAGNDVLVAWGFGSGFSSTREVSFFGGTGNDFYVLGLPVDTYGGQDSGGTDTALLLASGSIDNLEGVENLVLYGADRTLDAAARAALGTVYAAANGGAAYTGPYGSAFDATGNALANTIVGNHLDNKLVGGAGNDTISSGAGDDTLEGGAGTDSLTGGAGDDWYYLDTGDVAVEAAGGGFDVLASLTITSFTGYANFEGLQYLGATALNLNRGSGNVSADFLGGGSGNDTVSGFGGNDTLDGGAGNDTVNGGVGSDSLRGGAGNDSVLGSDGDDRLDGGDGADTVRGELGDDTLAGGTGNDLVDGGGNFDNLDGGEGNDSLTGGDGNDFVEGGAGDDILSGDNQNDTLVGGAGIDQLFGGTADRNNSGRGDHLWGGERFGSGDGATDYFAFDAVTEANLISETFTGSGVWEFAYGATIFDFEQGTDLIAVTSGFVGDGDGTLDGAVVKATAGGTFAAGAELVIFRTDIADEIAFSGSSFFDPIDAGSVTAVIGSASAAFAANETRLFVVDDGTHSALFLFQASDNNAAVTADELFLLAAVTGQSALTAADFVLF
ncbi:beta strand repeat-containing protein [Piscinibacter defluvii]|uniref:beta strand repeat-containing protein n=1 Tax=Piscinibacter defluvii TaxID=1796922 RepID=UPI000FDE97E2|nr:calcium-binding protein [Piscinibacter defluvii]